MNIIKKLKNDLKEFKRKLEQNICDFCEMDRSFWEIKSVLGIKYFLCNTCFYHLKYKGYYSFIYISLSNSLIPFSFNTIKNLDDILNGSFRYWLSNKIEKFLHGANYDECFNLGDYILSYLSKKDKDIGKDYVIQRYLEDCLLLDYENKDKEYYKKEEKFCHQTIENLINNLKFLYGSGKCSEFRFPKSSEVYKFIRPLIIRYVDKYNYGVPCDFENEEQFEKCEKEWDEFLMNLKEMFENFDYYPDLLDKFWENIFTFWI